MLRTMGVAAIGFAIAAVAVAQEPAKPAAAAPATKASKPAFAAPMRVKGGEEIIKLEEPGYAAPCLADLDGDGKKDLLVGQFAGGKIKVYPGLGEGKFGAGTWLQADGKVAEVPGVW
ncbi:MAG: VCBS repeat-containing protein [Planctomycetota bacterium]